MGKLDSSTTVTQQTTDGLVSPTHQQINRIPDTESEKQRNTVKPKRKRDESPKDENPKDKMRKQQEEEIRRSLFARAEDIRNYVVVIEDLGVDNKIPRFADLNYIQRIDILKRILKIEWQNVLQRKFEMKKFKRRTDKFYKVEVTVRTEEDMEALLAVKTLDTCTVKVTENIFKNSVQGIIIDHDENLKGMTNEEIRTAITHTMVRSVQRFGAYGKVISICFKGQNLPEEIRIWNELKFKVQPSIPPPVRCFKCQEYGHRSTACRNKYACYKCATKYEELRDHDPRTCSEQQKCVNCEKEHMAGNKECTMQKKEKAWAKICFDQGIRRKEAMERYPEGKATTYARATTKPNTVLGMAPNEIKNFNETKQNTKSEDLKVNEMLKRLDRIETALIKRIETPEVAVLTDTDSQWKEEQEKKQQDFQKLMDENNVKMERLQNRMTTQEQECANLKKKIETQSGVIKKLKEDIEHKDSRIEELIVENEQLKVSASIVMTNQIKQLKEELTKEKEKTKKIESTGRGKGNGGQPPPR